MILAWTKEENDKQTTTLAPYIFSTHELFETTNKEISSHYCINKYGGRGKFNLDI